AHLLRHHPPQPASDESGQVGQDPREGQAAGGGEVDGLPLRVELFLVLAEALEVVEVLAEAVGEGAGAGPYGAEGTVLQAGERRAARPDRCPPRRWRTTPLPTRPCAASCASTCASSPRARSRRGAPAPPRRS